jgi:sulfide:quinone oxidoreductase
VAKLAFQWIYWHVLLPGRDLPGVNAQMQRAGKDTTLLDNQGAAK